MVYGKEGIMNSNVLSLFLIQWEYSGWNIWKAGLSICWWAFGEKRVQEFDLITDFLKCLFKCLEFILFF